MQKHRLSARWIQKQIKELGDTVTIIEVARAFASEAYREETETYTTHTAYCHVWILTEQDTSVQEGEARAGDLIFSFDHSYSAYLKHMNRIIYDGRTFQISDVRPFRAIGNTLYMIECTTKKYSDNTAWFAEKTENITVTDGTDRNLLAKILSETLNTLDTESRTWDALKTFIDELKTGANPTKQITKPLSAELETSDSQNKDVGKSLSDEVIATDSEANIHTPGP
jgi:hypothetical protein